MYKCHCWWKAWNLSMVIYKTIYHWISRIREVPSSINSVYFISHFCFHSEHWLIFCEYPWFFLKFNYFCSRLILHFIHKMLLCFQPTFMHKLSIKIIYQNWIYKLLSESNFKIIAWAYYTELVLKYKLTFFAGISKVSTKVAHNGKHLFTVLFIIT